MKRSWRYLAIAFGAYGLSACASQSSSTLKMDPMHFGVIGEGEARRVETLDAEALFLEGNDAFAEHQYLVAASRYELILKRFPESRFIHVARFNAGLAHEKQGDFGKALTHFETYVNTHEGLKAGQDGLFRMAACYEGLEAWDDMLAVANRILAPFFSQISVIDRVGGLALQGRAQEGRGQLALAERRYKAALSLYQQNLSLKGFEFSRFVSMAQFRIAEIYRSLFDAIRFQLPMERMARDLEDKSNFFLMAQSAYLRALRLQHQDFATQAGYQLGSLYERMYRDMLEAEVPGDLNAEDMAIYRDELLSQIRPLLERAIDIYERNLQLSERMGARDGWASKTEASLERLRELLEEAKRSQLKKE